MAAGLNGRPFRPTALLRTYPAACRISIPTTESLPLTLPETISAPLARALAVKGYEALTSVQAEVLDSRAAGRDLLVSAQTGSGKTVAFGMAIAPTILGEDEILPEAGAPLALVIAPTRELALQVQRELTWLYAEAGAKLASCVGGMDMRTERRALERGAHIVVGTPGRLRDHITRHGLDMSALRAVILDEADEMLDLGFREDLEFILGEAPEDRRTLLFSATVPKPIAQLAKTFQRDALRISATGEGEQHVDIEYRQLIVAAPERENAIINTLLYHEGVNTIVFCSTREAVKHLSARLYNRGFAVVSLSGELSQAERTNALQSMRDGRARICVATDVAARGIDLPNLDLVIHADLPTNPETLLHRSGRTGRAGRKGTCIIVVPIHRRGVAKRILTLAKIDAAPLQPPTAAMIEDKTRQAILDAPELSATIEETERDFVAALLERHSPEQIAAAYLRQQLTTRPAPEDVSEVQVPEPRGPKDPRTAERFGAGTWFKLSLGRKHKAEPRWLLPMICKAGGVTKSAVGSIRILENETQFEVAADKADAFLEHVRKHGTGERSVTINPVGALSDTPQDAVARPAKRAWSSEVQEAPAERAEKPAKVFVKAKPDGKDKGKPKWKKKNEAGDAPRARKPKA